VPRRAAVEVEGARQLRKALAELGDDAVDELKAVNMEGVDIVLAEALTRVPVRSGRLYETVRGSATKTRGTIRAGFKKVPWAGPTHFGWPARNIEPNLFLYDAVDERRDEVIAVYKKNIGKLIKKNGL
jgi:hypothetical protein